MSEERIVVALLRRIASCLDRAQLPIPVDESQRTAVRYGALRRVLRTGRCLMKHISISGEGIDLWRGDLAASVALRFAVAQIIRQSDGKILGLGIWDSEMTYV